MTSISEMLVHPPARASLIANSGSRSRGADPVAVGIVEARHQHSTTQVDDRRAG